jgi:CIC family chloride channel protein
MSDQDSPSIAGQAREAISLGLKDLVERFNLRHVWYWLGLSGLVGLVGGLGALLFKWLTEEGTRFFWGMIVGYLPAGAGGEPSGLAPMAGPPSIAGLIVAPAIGGLLSAFLVFRFAPEARGHGTDAAIRAYHRQRGEIRARIPLIKMLASAITLSSGGSAGREGPIAQIGAGFGSLLGKLLKLSHDERRILLAAGMASGVGAIFRAPLAGAIFAAEVLYSGPDIEAEVLIPALLASIVSYSVYCSVHGFGHLFTGTGNFAFTHPTALPAYAVLGVVCGLGAIAFVNTFNVFSKAFGRLMVSNYLKPLIGASLTGMLGVLAWKATGDLQSLGIMGSGYGILQDAVSSAGSAAPSLVVLAIVAFGKMVTTSLTIGSGGSGGVFGPSMVIGGCLGGLVGGLFHMWMPGVVPDIGPFTIVGMAGFFAGAANTPISTLLIVSDLSGNYSLFLPAMLVVGIAFIIARKSSLYSEQVPTRADSPAHRGEFHRDVLAQLKVSNVYDPTKKVIILAAKTSLREIVEIAGASAQQYFPVVGPDEKLIGGFTLNDLRQVLFEEQAADLVVAKDLATPEILSVGPDDNLQGALDLLTIRDLAELPVLSPDRRVLGLVSRRDIIVAYSNRLVGGTVPPPAPKTG